MKLKKLLSITLAAAMFLSVGTGLSANAKTISSPVTGSRELSGSELSDYIVMAVDSAKSHNIGSHSYNWNGMAENAWNWAVPSHSFLAANADGTFTRVEYIGEELIIENYSSALALKSTKKLSPELPLFGGFFSGAKYNFIVYGQENTEDSDSVETVRVVKYDKSWNRKGAKSFYGINTHVPFDAGTVSMTEDSDRLYIHTCHTMYTSGDGYNHQANMTFFINKESMETVYQYYSVMNIDQTGYVSHSFNQVIRTDGKYVYTADHGDAYPRSIVIVKRNMNGSPATNSSVLAIKGSIGANQTKATLGDMQLSSSNVITAGASVKQDDSFDNRSQKNIFVSALSKSALTSQSFIWLTDYEEDAGITVCNPYLVKTGNNSFVAVWEELSGAGNKIRFAKIDGSGKLSGSVNSLGEDTDEGLSDCAPIFANGKIIWYSSGSRSDSWWNLTNAAPNFYRVPVNLSAPFITSQPANVTAKVGDTVTFTVKAKGSGLTYQWYYKKKSDSGWKVWSGHTDASASGKMTADWDGMQVYCAVSGADGETVNSEPAAVTLRKELTAAMTPQYASPRDAGTTIKLTVAASGGTGSYKYKFYSECNGVWTKLWDYSDSNTYNWHATTVGTHTVYCDVKDSSGKVVCSNFKYQINKGSAFVADLNANRISGQYTGTEIRLLAASSNGVGTIQYKFYSEKDGHWARLKDYGTQDYFLWTPTGAGYYNLYVDAKDAAGHSESKRLCFTVESGTPLKVKSLTANPSAPAVGSSVKLTAATDGGLSPVTYKFYYEMGGSWVKIRDFASSNTCTFTPSKAGTYHIYVDAIDGKKNTQCKMITVTVK
ncbi:MAG: hypothetical protein IJM51_09100 [Clostridia bacterium]|nr:hypothetical protein [Clostridia bacterium]